MMPSKTPDTSNDRAIEAFFAHLGLAVEVVDCCPNTACERCREALDRAA